MTSTVVCRFFFSVMLLLAASRYLNAQTATPGAGGQLSVLDFGAKGDGTTDDTAAFNAAVQAAVSKSLTLYFPCGVYRFAAHPNPIGAGIRLRGCGSVGSTIGYGASLVADYDERSPEEGFLTWNGGFRKGGSGCCAGTGGGIEGLVIFKGSAKKGGTALKFTGLDDGHRAGYSTISNVLISSTGGGTWDHNLIVDGTCCKTPHAQGVRDIYINNFWAAQAVFPDQSILLRNAVQVFWHGGEVMPAGSGAGSGITISGGPGVTEQSTNILISDVYVAGNLVLSNSHSVSFRGLVGGDVTIDSTASSVMLGGLVAGKIINRSSSAAMASNKVFALPPDSPMITRTLQTGIGGNADLAGSCTAKSNSCTYQFAGAYSLHPICTANDETTGSSAIKVTYGGTKSVTFTTPGPNDVVDFICVARD